VDDLLSGCLAFRLGSAFRRVDRLLNRTLAPIGLSHAHAQVLSCLLAGGELRVTDIAHRTGFEQSTVSRLAQELARRKLLRRRKHPDDGRASLYRPGVRAEGLRDEIHAILQKTEERLRRDLPRGDLEGFRKIIRFMEQLP